VLRHDQARGKPNRIITIFTAGAHGKGQGPGREGAWRKRRRVAFGGPASRPRESCPALLCLQGAAEARRPSPRVETIESKPRRPAEGLRDVHPMARPDARGSFDHVTARARSPMPRSTACFTGARLAKRSAWRRARSAPRHGPAFFWKLPEASKAFPTDCSTGCAARCGRRRRTVGAARVRSPPTAGHASAPSWAPAPLGSSGFSARRRARTCCAGLLGGGSEHPRLAETSRFPVRFGRGSNGWVSRPVEYHLERRALRKAQTLPLKALPG